MEDRPAQEIWEAALGELQLQVNKPNYKTWLEKTVGLSFQDNQFTVGVPNTFAAEYLDNNQRSLIEKTLINVTQRTVDVIFHVNGRHPNSIDSSGATEETATATRASAPALNAKYTFDSFVVGNSNRLAYTAALEVAQNPGHSYNPLFIFGEVGLGKTHLLHAIAHVAQASHLQVLYVSAERFTNEFITGIREKKTEAFRSKYRSVDILLIDDIQFISGKEQTEESLFHTFDELHNANHQIVFSSNCSPKSIPLRKEQLRSRFEWGLVARIQLPKPETRLAILQAKAEQQEVQIPLDVLEFIAQRPHQSIRELEGSLNRVVAYTRLIRVLPTPELAAQALEALAAKQPPAATITPVLVLEAVASTFQFTPLELKSGKRNKQIALARQVAMYLLRQETNCSLAKIGQELGGKNPSTVSHACTKIASDINASPYLRRKIEDIQQKFHSE